MINTLFQEKGIPLDVVKAYITPHFHTLCILDCVYDYPFIDIITKHPSYNHGNSKYQVLSIATGCGHLELVQHLVEVEELEVSGHVLSVACVNGHLPIVKYLVENGADVNWDDEEHHASSIISLVVGAGQVSVLEYLIEQGADVNDDDIFRVMPCDHNLIAFEYLVGAGIDKNRLVGYASWYGNWNFVLYLIDEGADPHTVFVDKTPVEWALLAGRTDIVRRMTEES
jgi:ankyrin repeat protein